MLVSLEPTDYSVDLRETQWLIKKNKYMKDFDEAVQEKKNLMFLSEYILHYEWSVTCKNSGEMTEKEHLI